MSKLDETRPPEQSATVQAAAARVLEAEPSIRWAYAFGSAARGEAFRDLDLAVILQPGGLRGTAFGGVIAALELATGGKVDLVDLQAAALPLRARIVREGKLLVDREPQARRIWEVEVTRRWLDIRPWLAEQDRLIRRRLLEGGWSTGN